MRLFPGKYNRTHAGRGSFCQAKRHSARQNASVCGRMRFHHHYRESGACHLKSRTRKLQITAVADGVAAVDRAIAILNAFTQSDRTLSLAELAARTGFYKSTILRLAGSLLRGQYLERLEGGRYRVGPAAFRLGALYQRGWLMRTYYACHA